MKLYFFRKPLPENHHTFSNAETLTQFEQQELLRRDNFANYLVASKVAEGLIKALNNHFLDYNWLISTDFRLR